MNTQVSTSAHYSQLLAPKNISVQFCRNPEFVEKSNAVGNITFINIYRPLVNVCVIYHFAQLISLCFFHSLQFLLVVFVGLFLQNQSLGKPHQSQDQDNLDQRFSDGAAKPSQTLNETVHTREKREASHPCVKKLVL